MVIRVRILFQCQEVYRNFMWFEMRGNDFYWGSSGEKQWYSSQEFSGDHVVITFPEKNLEANKFSAKYSYHQDGKVHLKRVEVDGRTEYKNHAVWRLKETISKPTRFCTIISKPPIKYDKYEHERIDRKKTTPIIFKTSSENEQQRHCFEFFLSPEGQFTAPPPMLKIKGNFIEQHPLSYSLNEHLILVIRHFTLSNFNDLHLDHEMAFIPDEI